MAKQKFRATGPIGKPGSPEFKEGDVLELDPEDENTKRLIRVGAIAEPAQVAAPAQTGPAEPAAFDPTNVADDELKGLNRDSLVLVAQHEGVEKIGDKNMAELIDEILEIRKGKE